MECDKTGKPCDLMAVQLLPENLLAWELYHQSRLEGVGPLIMELRVLELTEYDAEQLAHKLEVIGSTYNQVDLDTQKRSDDEAEMAKRIAGKGR